MMNAFAARIPAAALAGVGIAVLSAGCGDVTASTARFEPHLTLDRLDEVLAPLEEGDDLLLGLDLAVATLEYYGGGQLAHALSLRLDREDGLLRLLPRSQRPGQARARARAPGDAGTEAFTVPWMLVGETLEWDRTEGYVVSGRAGAPSNGVRFLLYRMDGQTGYPATPLSRIGYLDLIDADTHNEEAVRVRAIRTTGPDRVIADYRVSLVGSGTYDEGSLEMRTLGAFGDATSVELDLRQRMTWSRSRNRDEMSLDYGYRRGSSWVELDIAAQSRFDALDWETVDFDVAVRGGSVATDIDADIRSDGSLWGEMHHSGRRVVRIGGYDGRPTFESASGTVLSRSDLLALERIWTGVTDLLWLTDWMLVPADLLLASG